ncbi:MAG: EamA family transporter [Pseudorhodobacter sp.]|nr:EamA family transporter [Pseudorhodobacter sp.]
MPSLLLGLLAALIWGIHDFVVRQVTPRAATAPLLLLALLTGCLFLTPISLLVGGWQHLTPSTLGLAALSGLGVAAATAGLYRAFAIGPVRLVAPIAGAYPMLSAGIGAAQGHPIGAASWLGVAAIVGGIALVARQEEVNPNSPAQTRAAIGWAALAAIGYALTFGLAHLAAREGGAAPVTLLARVVALAAVAVWLIASRTALTPAVRLWRPLVLMGVLDGAAITLVIAAAGLANPEYAAVTSSLFGMVTIVLAARFLAEAMRPVQWLGVAVVFAGIGTLAAL